MQLVDGCSVASFSGLRHTVTVPDVDSEYSTTERTNPMSITSQPTHSVLPYQSPMERAYSASGKTALGLVIALLLAILPFGVKYLATGDFSHTAFVALLTASGVAAGGVLLNFLLKLQSAISDNTPPTVTALGISPFVSTGTIEHGTIEHALPAAPAQVPSVTLPVMPGVIDARIVVALIEDALCASLNPKPVPVTAPPESAT